jgi:hypothetical protein
LAFLLEDPDRFIDQMNARFEKQKGVHPDNPYGFDYSEVGVPMMAYMKTGITKKIEALNGILEEKSKAGALQKLGASLRRYPTKEVKIALRYLDDLSREADGYLRKRSVSYEQMIHFSNFYSRAIGHFDQRKQNFLKRLLLKGDNLTGGYKQLSIEDEYSMYLKKDYRLFQQGTFSLEKQGPKDSYSEAFTDQQKLRAILVPTNAELDYDVLMRLMSRHQVSLIGITYEPTLADGVLRPAGQFWFHDIRHEAMKFFKKTAYILKHHLDEKPEKLKMLNLLSDQWNEELEQSTEKIKDPELRETVRFLAFNFHHDYGNPTIPSVYMDWKGDFNIYLLYVASKLSGQDVAKYGRPLRNIAQAKKWMRDFWSARAAQENALLSDSPY